MNPMLNIAIHAIRQAGNFLIKQYEIFTNNTMAHKNNLLTKINKKSIQLISNIIKKYYPSHIIITQSNWKHEHTNHETQWIINPIDNQTNFTKHLPYFASSIAVKIKGCTEIAVIYDPIHNDLFSASKGQGTQLNGYRIHYHSYPRTIYNKEIILTYCPHYKKHIILDILNNNRSQNYINFRYSGAITLDLAYVAVGRIDAIFANNLETYKTDSGILIIKESGGLILNLNKHNKQNNTYTNIIAGNPRIIKFIINTTPTLKQFS